jgi:hypothetical protein
VAETRHVAETVAVTVMDAVAVAAGAIDGANAKARTARRVSARGARLPKLAMNFCAGDWAQPHPPCPAGQIELKCYNHTAIDDAPYKSALSDFCLQGMNRTSLLQV